MHNDHIPAPRTLRGSLRRTPARTVWGGLWAALTLALLLCLALAGQALAHSDQSEETIPLFAQGASLEAMRQIIAQQGYDFQVGHTWVYDADPATRQGLLSRHMPEVPAYVDPGPGPLAARVAELRKLGAARGLPERFDWRDVDGVSYVNPVQNQGSCGSCYAFAACAAGEGSYDVANGLSADQGPEFSEAFIAYCLSTLPEYEDHFWGCSGSDYDYYELTALVEQGVTEESAFPYVDRNPGACPAWEAPRTRFASWHRVPCGDVEAIKAAILTYGPVDAAVMVDGAFAAYTGGVFENDNTGCIASPCYYTTTNHCVALVGWDDAGDAENEGYFILRNSWGPTWGEGGYMRIRYRAAAVACEAAYFVAQELVGRELLMPHLTQDDPLWADFLLLDNLGDTPGEARITLHPGSQGPLVVELTPRAYVAVNLAALGQDASWGTVEAMPGEVTARLLYRSRQGGGEAEFVLGETAAVTGQTLAFLFSNASPAVTWKGLAVVNPGDEPAGLSLTAWRGGVQVGQTGRVLPAGTRLRDNTWGLFGLGPDQVERVELFSDMPVAGVVISGDATSTRLTSIPAVLLP